MSVIEPGELDRPALNVPEQHGLVEKMLVVAVRAPPAIFDRPGGRCRLALTASMTLSQSSGCSRSIQIRRIAVHVIRP